MHKKFLDLAFYYAYEAYQNNEVPIGAVIVKNGEVIAYGYNSKENNQSVLCHAELIAIEEASKKFHNWRLDECDLYVTLDPWPMCASAIKQARIKHVYSALNNKDENNLKIVQKIFQKDSINPGVEFISNLDVLTSNKLLSDFFKKQRNK